VQQLSSTSVASASAPSRSTGQKSHRIAAIDWMRGLVMVLMVLDHSSMAFDRHHLDEDSAFYTGASTMALPAAEFLTRWMTHICAPTFVFLAGTALALSVERRVAKGTDPWQIDRDILMRGALIALLDSNYYFPGLRPMDLSSFAGDWTFDDVHGCASSSSILGHDWFRSRLAFAWRTGDGLGLGSSRFFFDVGRVYGSHLW
jgi:hypothetical protein